MFGLNIDPRNPKGNPDPAELYELGVEIVRFTYADSSGGDQLDPAQLRFYKERVQAYKKVGIESLLILNYETYPNKPDPNAGDGEWDAYIDRLARRCGQIAREFVSWRPACQIWNEPDHPIHPGYAPTVREAVFGRMLRRTYDAIKAVDPKYVVVTGGLATGNPGWLERVVQSQGGNLPADAIAFHPYGQRPARDWPSPNWFFGFVGDLLNNYYKAGGNKPIWITEMGVKEEDLDHDRAKVSEFLRRYYSLIKNYYASKTHQLIWFCYGDGMVAPFGLVDHAGNRKPAYDAYRQAAPTRPPLKPQPVVQPAAPTIAAPPAVTAQPAVALAPPPLPSIFSGAPVSSPAVPTTTMNEPLEAIKQQAVAWQTQALQLQNQLIQFQSQLQQLLNQQAQLQNQAQQMQFQPAPGSGSTVSPGGPTTPSPGITTRPAPPIQNITTQLKRDPGKQFPTRPLSQIQRIVIHHTAIPPTVGAERIAQHRVDTQGWPGIGYHYFITGEGAIQQTNELTTQSTHAGNYDPVAIGVCFAGDFTNTVPTPAQIEAGAQLIAWLISQFSLPLASVNGYKELVVTQSPGQQWDSGARWGDQLKAKIQAYL
ncbi:MAG: N-acetylmuramoyl-L-alanine amidase [Anaerolineae bacterium]|nr:N-acetylmuramoyl-L-alanine amidase [Anaerolineae bacterium]